MDSELLARMGEAVRHRGPDGAGVWEDSAAEVGLAHRRLSIIDLSDDAAQPMSTADGQIVMVYNGELYNYREERELLQARGYTFRSESDSEVVLKLYEEYGVDFLDRLNGMFALAIWDARTDSLFLARDHVGIKPLYYAIRGDRIYFASEVRSLLEAPEITRELNHEELETFLTLLWVPGRQTMFKGISKLEPGHRLRWRRGHSEIRRWFRLPQREELGISDQEWAERLYETLSLAVRRQMISDVSIGAFLSGGLDSSSLVHLMQQHSVNPDVDCFTVGFREQDQSLDQLESDLGYARSVSRTLGVTLHERVPDPNILDLLPRIVEVLEEPDADPAAILSYQICEQARKSGTTVLLSGTGGDEVLFGYRSHQALGLCQRLEAAGLGWLDKPTRLASRVAALGLGAPAALPRRLAKFSSGLGAHGFMRHVALAQWSSASTRRRLLGGRAQGSTPGLESLQEYYNEFDGSGVLSRHSEVLNFSFLASHNFLYTDKTSMAHSVEVRVPFMDLEVMRLAAKMPEQVRLRGDVTKAVLRDCMRGRLPKAVLGRGKTGFGVPLRKWLKVDLQGFLRDHLSPIQVSRRGLFEPHVVERVVKQVEKGTGDAAYLVFGLLWLELWQREYLDTT